MKKIIILVFSCIFSGTWITNSYGEETNCLPEKYCGDEKSFNDFKTKYKKDWPTPSQINYYDPNDTNTSVIRYAHWMPAKVSRKGVVVHFNGRTEFIEKNIYTYKDLLERGFEVWAFDWRGQGFSKRETNEKQKHNIKTFDVYLADATYFIDKIAKIKETNGKKVLLAHSMGGQIALRYLIDNPDTFNYAVLSSPLLRIPGDNRTIRVLNHKKISIGRGDRCAGLNVQQFRSLYHSPTWLSDYKNIADSCKFSALSDKTDDNLVNPKETKRYSNDLNKVADIDCLIESSIDAKGVNEPDLRLACATSNWLHAAFDSTDAVMKRANELNTPTLIVRALPDTAVDNIGQDDFCKHTKKCTIISIASVEGVQTGHELLIEQEPIRKIFFDLFDGFLARNN